MAKSITFVTGNKHKFEEVSALFEKYLPGFALKQSLEPLSELQADTLEEVAEFKVNSINGKINGPYFIEDAGFFVDDVCNGFPGVYSSYVMKTIGNQAILKIMEGKKERSAHFESVIAFIDEGVNLHLFKGVNKGFVSDGARGTSGFGFDPIFISHDTPSKTFAELTLEEKNVISHRRRSMQAFMDYLKEL